MYNGIEQGNPASSQLFSLLLTLMVKKIEQSLTGISFHGKYFKVMIYIDEIGFLVKDEKEVIKIINIINEYGISSEVKLNLSKTKVMPLHANAKMIYSTVEQPDAHLTILGIELYPTIKDTMKYNENRLVCNIVFHLTKFQNCFDLLISRVRFVNCYILSKWTYYLYLQLFTMSQLTYAQISKYIGYFIWRKYSVVQ